jgi:hypothetical protein
MIGGYDVLLPGLVLPDDMDVLLRASRAAWPSAMVESGDGQTLLTVGEALRVRWPISGEVFIYKTRGAYASWTASGLTDENANEMVAITLEQDCIAFVVSDAAAPTSTMVDEMIEAVKENRWLALARSAA